MGLGPSRARLALEIVVRCCAGDASCTCCWVPRKTARPVRFADYGDEG